MVRLKSAYIIKCEEVIRDADGKVTEVRCSYLPESKSGADTSGISVKGTLHWVSVAHGIPIEIRLYDRLFKVEDPSNAEGDFKDYINPDSLQIIPNAVAEPTLGKARFDDRYQFLRKGYFCMDKDSSEEKIIFNRTVTLKDAWAKEQKKRLERFFPAARIAGSFQSCIIKNEIAKSFHAYIQPAVVDKKIGCMVWRRFLFVGTCRHAAEIDKKCGRLFTEIRKILCTGNPISLCDIALAGRFLQ